MNKFIDDSKLRNDRDVSKKLLKRRLLLNKLKEKGNLKKEDQTSKISVVDRSLPQPLSWAQQRLWFIDQINKNASVAYHMSSAIRVRGKLNFPVLNKAINSIIERHEILRTVYKVQDGEPVQIVKEHVPFELTRVDLTSIPENQLEDELQKLSDLENEKNFDLSTGPVIRACLFTLGTDYYQLQHTVHHIAFDGWSENLFSDELFTLYDAYSEGKKSPLPKLQYQYVDYAAWQRDSITKEDFDKQLEYWVSQHQESPGILELPLDFPRPVEQQYDGDIVDIEFTNLDRLKIRGICKRHGLTTNMFLLGVFSLLLSRLSNQNSVVVGLPVSNRKNAELEELIGVFLNTIAIRTDVRLGHSITQYFSAVKQSMVGALKYQDMPFESVVQALGEQGDLSRSPVFQAMLVLDNTENISSRNGNTIKEKNREDNRDDLTLDGGQDLKITAQFDITAKFDENDEGLAACFVYSTSLFCRDTIVRWADYFKTIVSSILEDDAQALYELPLLGEMEKSNVVSNFNNTKKVYLEENKIDQVTIHGLFENQVNQTPNAPAVEFGETVLTYQELNNAANVLAHSLISMGVGPDVTVGVFLERSEQMLIAVLAILKSGGAYVPIDPEYPNDRIEYVLDDSKPLVVITQEYLSKRLDNKQNVSQLVLDSSYESNASDLSAYSENPSALNITASNIAYVIYTSGSTGRPKGVMNEHLGVVNLLLWMQDYLNISKADTFLQKAPFSFDVSVWEFFLPLISGSKLIVAKPQGHKDPIYLENLIERKKISIVHFVPSMLSAYLSVCSAEKSDSLRLVVSGGEELPVQLQNQCLQTLPNSELHNSYGPTEAAVGVTHWECEQDENATKVPIGYPIANLQMYILDEYLQPQPIGVTGELYIGGIGVARGYLNKENLTKERFIDNPFVSDNERHRRLYKTGDLCRWSSNGYIEYLGRNDFQVKLRGFRIELGEIESSLLRHSSIDEVSVIATDGQSTEKQLVCYFTSSTDKSDTSVDLSGEALRIFLKGSLPDYMLPVGFIRLDKMPVTSNGKLDRDSLPSFDIRSTETTEYEAPINDMEQQIAQIWSQLLKTENVGRNNHFFKLGGNSLLAVKLVHQINLETKKVINLNDVFEVPVLKDLAQRISSSTAKELCEIPSAGRAESLPVSWAQQRLWFLNQLDENASASYHMPLIIDLSDYEHLGRFNGDVLQAALVKLAQRHESFRTFFESKKDGVYQSISDFANLELLDTDFLDYSGDTREEAVESEIARLIAKPFNLDEGPLVRANLLKVDQDNNILLLVIHHIICDGISVSIIKRELESLYESSFTGNASPLEELRIQYADYSVWQRDFLSGDSLKQLQSYWQSELKGIPSVHSLPLDFDRPVTQSYQGGSIDQLISVELSSSLRRLAKEYDVTLFMLLHAAFSVLLSRYSGEKDIVIGTTVANRQHPGLDEIVGFFVNTLILRLDVDKDHSFVELLGSSKQKALAAYQHEQMPFDLLVEVLEPERSLSYNPLFQVMLSMDTAQEFTAESIDNDLTNKENLFVAQQANQLSQFDLLLDCNDLSENISFAWEYATDLFSTETISQMAAHFELLLKEIVANPSREVGKYNLLSVEDRTYQLDELSGEIREYPGKETIHEQFEYQVLKCPNKVAAVYNNQSKLRTI